MNRKGFTLIELVIVIVILGILAAVAIPRFVDLTTQAKNSATKGALGGLRSGISIWYASNVATGGAGWPALVNFTDPANTMLVMAQGIPANPRVATSISTAIVATTADPSATVADAAWVYNTANGKIWAADSLSD